MMPSYFLPESRVPAKHPFGLIKGHADAALRMISRGMASTSSNLHARSRSGKCEEIIVVKFYVDRSQSIGIFNVRPGPRNDVIILR
jgi:hypothetical protein